MLPVLTAQKMKAEDAHTIHGIGVPSAVLMERAACAVAEEVLNRTVPGSRILVLAGSGNNGGDGFACARILHLGGRYVKIVSVGRPDHRTEETSRQAAICGALGISVEEDADAGSYDLSGYDVIVDAMLGIGLGGTVSGRIAGWILRVNSAKAWVIAVDIPSGISADTGSVLGCAVSADMTVTMQCLKPGLLLYPGAHYAGEVKVAEIGVTDAGMPADPDSPAAGMHLVETADLPHILLPRDPSGNKGTFGKVLAAAGSSGMAGASLFCMKAALAAGCGMVRAVTPSCNRVIVQSAFPEGMLSCFETPEEAAAAVSASLPWCDAVVLGPGIGTGDAALSMVRTLLEECTKPVTADADALNLLSEHKELFSLKRCPLVLTPHIGEMSRLTGQPIAMIKGDPVRAASEFAAEYGVICVLKDARTVTALPDGTVYFSRTGNSGMATAGSGDVLAGICASLLAQGTTPGVAAAAAVCLHGAAGDAAALKYGERAMTASDLIEGIGTVLKDI